MDDVSPAEKRPRDPQRPARIVAAAREIIRSEGVMAVSHRRVAEVAGVPLGSTTYYFATIEDLLRQAIEEDIEAFRTRVNAELDATRDGAPTERMLHLIGAEAAQNDVRRADYQLYLVALLRPELLPCARAWSDTVIDLFARIVPRPTAIAVAALLDGYALREAIAGDEEAQLHDELEIQVRALLSGA
jgi:DNA-binding transcriptional regulator YbjK